VLRQNTKKVLLREDRKRKRHVKIDRAAPSRRREKSDRMSSEFPPEKTDLKEKIGGKHGEIGETKATLDTMTKSAQFTKTPKRVEFSDRNKREKARVKLNREPKAAEGNEGKLVRDNPEFAVRPVATGLSAGAAEKREGTKGERTWS